MKNAIEQTLRRGIDAHKRGDLKDAERLYQAVLNTQPLHPHANHNLGVLAVSLNKTEIALPFLKTALEVNPKIEQFWLSYIAALIKEKKLYSARQVLGRAKAKGVDGDRLNSLEAQLAPETEKLNTTGVIPPKDLLNSLLVHYHNGRFSDVEKLALSITQEFPEHNFAWKVLGAALGALGKTSQAVVANQKAVALNPHDAESHSNLGNTLKAVGRVEDAEASYRRAIGLNSNLAEAYSNLGVTLQELQRLDEAEVNCRQALALEPDFAEAHLNLGVTLQDLGRRKEAEASYRRAIALNPNFAGGYSNLGVTLLELGRLEEALASCRQAVALKPDYAESHLNLGNTLKELGRLDEAKNSYNQTIVLKPDYAEAYYNLGIVLQETGESAKAEASYSQAIALKPDYAEALSNLGILLRLSGRLDEAESSGRQAIALKPDYAEAHNNLGNSHRELGKLDKAEANYRRALSIRPNFARAYSNLLFLNASMRFDESSNRKTLQGFSDMVTEQISAPYSVWSGGKSLTKLRVGFVSGDFKQHPVGYFLEGLLCQLQSSFIVPYAYSTNNPVGEVTDRLKALFHSWVSILGKSDKDAAKTIHDDGVHILVDLSGHTAENRLPIFGWKPAPIQITWLGYFASTGLPEMDYILGDPFVTPQSEAHHFTEEIWQLPESYLCFTPPAQDLTIGPLPALKNGFLTFGCFNNISKMTDEVVSVRADILHAVSNSKLFLKDKRLDHQSGRDQVLSRFAAYGIFSDRILLEGSSSREEYLKCYHRVDIALSPFPYGGGTTSVEGLWMGVPVITKKGSHFLSHLGESIAHNSNLSDWIAENNDDYIAKAVEFSSDLSALEMLRQSLRENLLKTPLFDLQKFANNFEKALFGMRESISH